MSDPNTKRCTRCHTPFQRPLSAKGRLEAVSRWRIRCLCPRCRKAKLGRQADQNPGASRHILGDHRPTPYQELPVDLHSLTADDRPRLGDGLYFGSYAPRTHPVRQGRVLIPIRHW